MRWGFISTRAKHGVTQHGTLLINHIHTRHQTFLIIFFNPLQLLAKGFQFQPVKHTLKQIEPYSMQIEWIWEMDKNHEGWKYAQIVTLKQIHPLILYWNQQLNLCNYLENTFKKKLSFITSSVNEGLFYFQSASI
jgi:hypothetical protein